MSIGIGDTIPKTVQGDFIKTGTVFGLFDPNCTWKVKHYIHPFTAPSYQRLPHQTFHVLPIVPRGVGNELDYANVERALQLEVTNDVSKGIAVKPWGKKNYMLRMKLARHNPFAGCTYVVTSQYSEAINPTFPVTSTLQQFTGVFPPEFFDGFMSWSLNPPGIGDPWGASSAGQGSGQIRIVCTAPSDNCQVAQVAYEATLGSLGKDYAYLAGMTVVFDADAPQVPPTHGNFVDFGFYWSGVTFDWLNPLYGPGTGLIMLLTHHLTIYGPG